jgi:hypothetical protein
VCATGRSDIREHRAAISLYASVFRVCAQPGYNHLNRASGGSARAVGCCAALHQVIKCAATLVLQRGVVDAATQRSHNCADGISRCIAFQPQAAQRRAALRLLVRAAAARVQRGYQFGRLERVRLLHCASRRARVCARVVARAESKPVREAQATAHVVAAAVPLQRAREQRRGACSASAARARV